MNWIRPIELKTSTLTNYSGQKLNWKHKKKPQSSWRFKIEAMVKSLVKASNLEIGDHISIAVDP